MKKIKVRINKNGSVSKKSINDVLNLPEAGNIAYFQGNVMQYSVVRGNDNDGYYAMNPLLPYSPHVRVKKIDTTNFVFDEF
jgi:hypothetical protein